MASEYMDIDDITDNVLNGLGTTIVQAKIDLFDAEILKIANGFGMSESEIETDDVDQRVVDYGKAWVGRELCLDFMGTNNNDLPTDLEKYAVKYKFYDKLASERLSALSKEVLGNTAYDQRDYATHSTGTIFRS